MGNGRWQMGKHWGFAIFHLTSAIQDAFFSIVLKVGPTRDCKAMPF